jgi:hypothetical protein
MTDSASEGTRYTGRPLLIVLENYVLDCIGELTPEKQHGMRGIVQRVWEGGEDWKATVRAQLDLQEGLDDDLRGLWEKNRHIAHDAGQELQSVDFARMIVDENFAQYIDPAPPAAQKPWWKVW